MLDTTTLTLPDSDNPYIDTTIWSICNETSEITESCLEESLEITISSLNTDLDSLPKWQFEYYSESLFNRCHQFLIQTMLRTDHSIITLRNRIFSTLKESLENDWYRSDWREFTALNDSAWKVFKVTPTPIYRNGNIDHVRAELLINFIWKQKIYT